MIAANRPQLSVENVKELATGQIFTANQSKANGLVDEIGFLEDVVAALESELGLSETRVVTYYSAPSILETVTGYSQANAQNPLNVLMDASVPRAMYLFSWKPIGEAYDADE